MEIILTNEDCKVKTGNKKSSSFLLLKGDKGQYSDIVFVNTVERNRSKYTIREYPDTVCMCSLQDILG